MKTIPILDISRSCNGCTACCDGWLTGSVLGHHFWPGRKCHYVSDSGCSIYEQRPHDPCHIFMCQWLIDKNFPEWLKPSLSNVIFVEREIDGITYMHAHEAGGKMDSEVLSWFIMEYAKGKFPNIAYTIVGANNYVGRKDFIEAVNKVTEAANKSL